MIGRRKFISLLGGASAWPITSRAQTPVKRVIGNLAAASFTSAAPQLQAFLAGMSELGYLEGRDYEMVRKSAEGVGERLPILAAEMVRLKPDVIMANPTPAVVALKAHTSNIPIVSFMLADEIRLGLVANSARPGGNVTGLLMRLDGMSGKQVELATEIVPGAKKIGILFNPTSADAATQRRESEAASIALGVNPIYAALRDPSEIQPTFQRMESERVQVAIVLFDALFFQERNRLAILAASHRIPVVYAARDHAVAGGLVSYGISLRANAHRAATYIDRILKGAKAADLPLEFPTRLELVINLGTAKALALEVPPTLLARADEVIE
jgi:putative ABC transport system substrate-binding protein